MRPTEFQTSDLDLAAAIMTATNKRPEIYRQPGHQLKTFEFPSDDITKSIVIAYAAGELIQPVKRFAACRSWLYRHAKGVY